MHDVAPPARPARRRRVPRCRGPPRRRTQPPRGGRAGSHTTRSQISRPSPRSRSPNAAASSAVEGLRSSRSRYSTIGVSSGPARGAEQLLGHRVGLQVQEPVRQPVAGGELAQLPCGGRYLEPMIRTRCPRPAPPACRRGRPAARDRRRPAPRGRAAGRPEPPGPHLGRRRRRSGRPAGAAATPSSPRAARPVQPDHPLVKVVPSADDGDPAGQQHVEGVLGSPSAMSTSPRVVGRRSPHASSRRRVSSSRGRPRHIRRLAGRHVGQQLLDAWLFSAAVAWVVTPVPRRRSTTASPRPAGTTRMIGWPTRPACRRACLPGDWSQQPTCPQVRHSRRWTQGDPIRRHSSQPWGRAGTTSGRTGQVWVDPTGTVIVPRFLRLQRLVQPAAQRRLRSGSGLAGEHLAVPQDHQRGDGAHLEPLGEPGCLVDVHLDQLELPARSVASRSRAGLTIRHGPHQVAHRSTSTGTGACSATSAKSSSPASAIQGRRSWQLPHFGTEPADAGTRFRFRSAGRRWCSSAPSPAPHACAPTARGDDELVVAHVDPHGGPLDGPVAQQRAGDLGLDLSGDESTQRPAP